MECTVVVGMYRADCYGQELVSLQMEEKMCYFRHLHSASLASVESPKYVIERIQTRRALYLYPADLSFEAHEGSIFSHVGRRLVHLNRRQVG